MIKSEDFITDNSDEVKRNDDTKYNVTNDITKMTSVIELSNALNEK